MIPQADGPSDDDLRAIELEQGLPPLVIESAPVTEQRHQDERAVVVGAQVAFALDDLDAMLSAAIDARRSAVPTKAKRREKPAGLMRLDSLYKDPANWRPERNVSLVHQGADGVATLLGHFVEFRHISIPSARKLIQAAFEPSLPTGPEFVSDQWYIEQIRRPHGAPSRLMTFKMSLQLWLGDLASPPNTGVLVRAVRDEGISRVELLEATRFTGLDLRTILFLPQGLDILEPLSRECKLAVKEQFERESQDGTNAAID